ncbi:hypothetical protein HK101_005226 [Irineochytrium annulatum]|nr:hypothetical protein HK101_005226 [Irineochytrium annulatum]
MEVLLTNDASVLDLPPPEAIAAAAAVSNRELRDGLPPCIWVPLRGMVRVKMPLVFHQLPENRHMRPTCLTITLTGKSSDGVTFYTTSEFVWCTTKYAHSNRLPKNAVIMEPSRELDHIFSSGRHGGASPQPPYLDFPFTMKVPSTLPPSSAQQPNRSAVSDTHGLLRLDPMMAGAALSTNVGGVPLTHATLASLDPNLALWHRPAYALTSHLLFESFAVNARQQSPVPVPVTLRCAYPPDWVEAEGWAKYLGTSTGGVFTYCAELPRVVWLGSKEPVNLQLQLNQTTSHGTIARIDRVEVGLVRRYKHISAPLSVYQCGSDVISPPEPAGPVRMFKPPFHVIYGGMSQDLEMPVSLRVPNGTPGPCAVIGDWKLEHYVDVTVHYRSADGKFFEKRQKSSVSIPLRIAEAGLWNDPDAWFKGYQVDPAFVDIPAPPGWVNYDKEANIEFAKKLKNMWGDEDEPLLLDDNQSALQRTNTEHLYSEVDFDHRGAQRTTSNYESPTSPYQQEPPSPETSIVPPPRGPSSSNVLRAVISNSELSDVLVPPSYPDENGVLSGSDLPMRGSSAKAAGVEVPVAGPTGIGGTLAISTEELLVVNNPEESEEDLRRKSSGRRLSFPPRNSTLSYRRLTIMSTKSKLTDGEDAMEKESLGTIRRVASTRRSKATKSAVMSVASPSNEANGVEVNGAHGVETSPSVNAAGSGPAAPSFFGIEPFKLDLDLDLDFDSIAAGVSGSDHASASTLACPTTENPLPVTSTQNDKQPIVSYPPTSKDHTPAPANAFLGVTPPAPSAEAAERHNRARSPHPAPIIIPSIPLPLRAPSACSSASSSEYSSPADSLPDTTYRALQASGAVPPTPAMSQDVSPFPYTPQANGVYIHHTTSTSSLRIPPAPMPFGLGAPGQRQQQPTPAATPEPVTIVHATTTSSAVSIPSSSTVLKKGSMASTNQTPRKSPPPHYTTSPRQEMLPSPPGQPLPAAAVPFMPQTPVTIEQQQRSYQQRANSHAARGRSDPQTNGGRERGESFSGPGSAPPVAHYVHGTGSYQSAGSAFAMQQSGGVVQLNMQQQQRQVLGSGGMVLAGERTSSRGGHGAVGRAAPNTPPTPVDVSGSGPGVVEKIAVMTHVARSMNEIGIRVGDRVLIV